MRGLRAFRPYSCHQEAHKHSPKPPTTMIGVNSPAASHPGLLRTVVRATVVVTFGHCSETLLMCPFMPIVAWSYQKEYVMRWIIKNRVDGSTVTLDNPTNHAETMAFWATLKAAGVNLG